MTNNNAPVIEIRLSNAAAFSFLDAHLHAQEADRAIQAAEEMHRSDEPMESPESLQEYARQQIAQAENRIHEFVREVEPNGLSSVIGTFGPLVEQLTDRLNGLRHRANTDIDDWFLWSAPLFDFDSEWARESLLNAPSVESARDMGPDEYPGQLGFGL